MIRLAITYAVLLASTCAVAEALPVDTFAGLPDVSQVRLSPNGKQVAALVKINDEGKMIATAVRVVDLETGESKLVAHAQPGKFTINWIRWANNRHVLVSARFPAKRYGTPTTETRLLSVDVESLEMRSVLTDSFLRKQSWIPQSQDRIVDMLPEADNEVLLAVNLTSPSDSDLLRADITKNRTKKLVRGMPDIVTWITDRQNRPRIAVRRNDAKYYVLHRSIDGGGWDSLWSFEAFSAAAAWPLGFDKDPNALYVRQYHEGRAAIFKVDLRDQALSRELVFADPDYDVDGSLIYSKASGNVIGIQYSKGGGFTFWDPEYQALQRAINTALPDTTNILYAMSENERRYVVMATNDVDPGTFYLGDRDSRSLIRLAQRYSALQPDQLSPKVRVEYEARDGLKIEGFLTLPRDKGDDPIPAIVFPHGGPISFDDGGFDYWTQYFASRGYAVLQMNFRGSAGYGYDFMKSGLQNWGLEMQNDVEDGTRWLIEQGLADPKRICVVGASYGGYAALMEAARNPDLYQCAISFAGVTDVAYLVRSHRRYTNYDIVKEQVGSDYSELKKRSPLHNAESISIPVLLAHGTEDRSVRLWHGRKMRRALEKNGKDVTYLEFEGGDHYLSQQQHRIEFFQAMDSFLNSHL